MAQHTGGDARSRDTELARRLAALQALADRPPSAVQEEARAAFDRAATDSELLELTYDSFLDSDPDVASTRDQFRVLGFARGPFSVTLTIEPHDQHCNILGRLEHGSLRSVEVWTPTDGVAAEVESATEFVAVGVSRRPLSVHLDVAGIAGTADRQLHTDWLSV